MNCKLLPSSFPKKTISFINTNLFLLPSILLLGHFQLIYLLIWKEDRETRGRVMDTKWEALQWQLPEKHLQRPSLPYTVVMGT